MHLSTTVLCLFVSTGACFANHALREHDIARQRRGLSKLQVPEQRLAQTSDSDPDLHWHFRRAGPPISIKKFTSSSNNGHSQPKPPPLQKTSEYRFLERAMSANPNGPPLDGDFAVQTDREVIAGHVQHLHQRGPNPDHRVSLHWAAERVSTAAGGGGGSDSGLEDGPGRGKCRVRWERFQGADPLRDRVKRAARATARNLKARALLTQERIRTCGEFVGSFFENVKEQSREWSQERSGEGKQEHSHH